MSDLPWTLSFESEKDFLTAASRLLHYPYYRGRNAVKVINDGSIQSSGRIEAIGPEVASGNPHEDECSVYGFMPLASFQDTDKYMFRAGEFLSIACADKGHREVASLTQTCVARYMAFLDGKRLP